MRHRTTWIAILLTTVLAVGPLAAVDDSTERAAVQKAIEQSIGWAIEKDFEAMFRLWGDDLFHFWLFSDSQVIGLENFKKHAEQWRDPDFRGTRFEFRDLRIVFSRSGEVAWYSCRLDDCGSFKGKEFCLKDVFQTGVLEKRDGRWVHVLMHGSYPVDKVPEGYVRRFYRDLFEKPEVKEAKPPGMTPELFAPGVVFRDGIQMKLTMSADGTEILYTERDPATNACSFVCRRRAGDSWGEPVVLPYAREYMDIEPSLSPDGRRILFVSNRPVGGGDPVKYPDIWLAEKIGDRWGDPVRLGPPVNTAEPADIEAHPAFGPDGGIYFMRQNGKSRRLFQAARRGDGFDEPRPVPLQEDLFAGGFSGPCLSPDGRILLMHSRRDGGFGNWDLYVAFLDESGGWSELMNLGPTVNTGQPESSPTFSADGRFIFFTRETDIFWVSAAIIEELRAVETARQEKTIRQHESSKLAGPYLDQRPPGMTPEIFAPGIISTGMSESAIVVTPDGKEVFYTVHAGNSETIITTRFENGRWTAPEVAPFSGKYLDGFPAMHPDGSKLFFHSYRPLDTASQIADVVNIWFVEKKGAGWSEPKPIGPPVNGNGFVCCPSVTKTGTLYFSKKTTDGGEKIYRSRLVSGKYMEPEELPRQVNREKEQYHAVISPDESYLILPRDNYLVSFRDEQDRWSDLIPLGDVVNQMRSGGCPSLSSDGKYFFFTAYPRVKWNKYFEKRHTYKDLQDITLQHPAPERTDIFWVDMKIIEELRPKE